MASSSLFIFITFILACFTSTQADLIGEICGNTHNPAFCNTVIRSDSRSNGADLSTIGKIVVDKAIEACNQVIAVAKSVRNPKTKMVVDDCVEVSGLGIDNMEECKKWLPPHNVFEVDNLLTKVSSMMTDMDTCDAGFGDVGEPEELKEATHRASDLGSIMLVVAHSF